MIKLFTIAFSFLCLSSLIAQVAVGKSTVNGSAILDFASGSNQGILLPVVKSLPQNNTPSSTNGTMLVDASNSSNVRLKLRENGTWKQASNTGSLGNFVENPADEEPNSGVIIGSSASAADGVLVLESTNKALVLPHVENPHLTIVSPQVGTICYDTVSKSLAMFDGVKWNYWR